MSFTFKSDPLIDCKPNLGSLSLNGEVYETPCLVISSYVGSLLYTTPDCLSVDLNQDNKHIGQLEISDLVRKDFGDIPISTLRKGSQTLVLSSRNVVHNVATTDSTGINIDSFNGRIHISVADYAKRIALDNPSIVIAFSDEVDLNSGRKRLSKAVERSSTWFSELTACPVMKESNKPFLFGVVVPVPEVPSHTSQYSSNLLTKGAQGLVVGCSHMGESEEVRERNIKEVRSAAGGRAPVMIQGADSLRQILLSLSQGVDLISTNYPSLITARGFALCWDHKRQHPISSSSNINNNSVKPLSHKKKRSVFDLAADHDQDEEQEETERGAAPAAKKTKQEGAGGSEGVKTEQPTESASAAAAAAPYPKRPKHIQKPPSASERPTCNQHRPIERCSEEDQQRFEQNLMLLWDDKYERDDTPLMAECKCHACKYHTKAYIHHLLIAKEMLAEVLLYHHNVYQLNQMMRTARERRAQGVDRFDSWLEDTLSTL